MNRLRGRLTYSNVLATVALAFALAGGTAFAATQLQKESVGTNALKKEAVTPSKLSRKARSGMIGPAGPAGPKGDPGARGERGEAGAPATTLTAHISAVGKLLGGNGVTGIPPSEKAYAVDFDRDVGDCNFQVTLDRTSGTASVVVGPLEGDPDGVVVEPLDSNGNHVLRPFYLAVFC
ncbi:MAG TPA: hypothetical protein VHA76_08005 [Solirubrobacterales bacterium]|nr:hypothetical protein [Solirubrobacterales bacterium]